MNRNECRYRWTGKAIRLLLSLWVGNIVLAWAVLSTFPKSELAYWIFFLGIAPVLFVAIFVLSVVNFFSYCRWTGRYPFFFFSPKSRGGEK